MVKTYIEVRIHRGRKFAKNRNRQAHAAGLFFPDVKGTFVAQSANTAWERPLRGPDHPQVTAERTRPRFMTGQF